MSTAVLYGKPLAIILEEQIRFPLLVDCATKILDKGYVCWFSGRTSEFHARFIGGSVPFAIIAFNAGAYEVFPCVLAISGFGQHVVHRKGRACCAAVLATTVIPADNVAPRKLYLFVGKMDIGDEPDNAGIGKRSGYRVNTALFALGNKFGLCKEQ